MPNTNFAIAFSWNGRRLGAFPLTRVGAPIDHACTQAKRQETRMSLDALIDRYCEAWSHESPEERRQALRECWGDSAVYSDPTVLVEGADALAAHITGLRERVPNMKIARTSQVDVHHDSARFNWGLTSNGAPTLSAS